MAKKVNFKKEFINFLSRKEFPITKIDFDVVLKEALASYSGLTGIDLDSKVSASSDRHWNYLKKMIDQDEIDHMPPVVEIVDDLKKEIICFGQKNGRNNYLFSKSKSRCIAINKIDSLSDRQFEALSVLICKCLGADKLLLTAPGNEGGIDFFARLTFSRKAHYLFGINGPLRIIGQCKMYQSRVGEKDIKEFNDTLVDVYRGNPKLSKIVPTWFKSGKGLIVPWFVSHKGFQSGAITKAKNQGIVLSNSRRLADELVKSRLSVNDPNLINQFIEDEISNIISSLIINPSGK